MLQLLLQSDLLFRGLGEPNWTSNVFIFWFAYLVPQNIHPSLVFGYLDCLPFAQGGMADLVLSYEFFDVWREGRYLLTHFLYFFQIHRLFLPQLISLLVKIHERFPQSFILLFFGVNHALKMNYLLLNLVLWAVRLLFYFHFLIEPCVFSLRILIFFLVEFLLEKFPLSFNLSLLILKIFGLLLKFGLLRLDPAVLQLNSIHVFL